MINHLKEIHRELYLPQAPDSAKPPFKVTPINDPYLYTDANLYVDTFNSPNQSVKVEVSNVGGGRLNVERIRIPRGFERWIKRAERLQSATLTSNSEPIKIELKLFLKALPNPSSVNVVKLTVLSNSRRKTFSEILLRVHPLENQSTNLTLPKYLNFGEITVCKVSVADCREDAEAPPAEFLLIGDFTLNPPTRLEITQKDESSFDAKIFTPRGELSYELDLQKPGVVMSGERQERYLQSLKQTVSIANVGQHRFSGQVITSDSEWWLVAPSEISVGGYDTTDLPVSVNVEKLEPGRNCGEIVVADKKIQVWVWSKIVNETALTLEKEQPNIRHVEQFSEQEKSLPIEVVLADEPYQSLMIFEDINFQFPLASDQRTGYLMGDFNQWAPRTLFLEKRDDGYGVTLSVSEGTYRYHAEIDGEMRLDPARLYEIVCCQHGLASKLQINRTEQKVTLQNRSKRKLEIKLQSTTKWMRIKPDTIVLPASKKSEITAVFRPERLLPGLNLGWLQMETVKRPKRSLHAPIYVIGMTNGAVPVLRTKELDFPQMEQGKVEGIPLAIDIFGEGELKGEIQPSTALRFVEGDLHVQNKTALEPMAVAPLVQVLTERPSNAYRKQIWASLLTDCYLMNHRVHRFKAKYDMIHLVSDPLALYLPKVYLFDDPQHVDIAIKRSDGKGNVACSVEIPDALTETGFLKVKNNAAENNTGHCEFVINPQARTNAGRVSDTLRLTDTNSGMALPIQFVADIVGGEAKIDVNTQGQRLNLLSGGIPLVITNISKTELRIFELRFKYRRFYLSPHLTSQQRTLLPGESIERFIKMKATVGLLGKRTVSLLGRTTVKDTLIIRLNDPQFPKGVFEKEIVAEI